MRSNVARMLTASALLVWGCGASTSQRGGDGAGGYSNEELQMSFRVPSGWSAPKAWNPLRKPDYVVRFESPDGEAQVTAGRSNLAGINCSAAASVALKASSGSLLESEKEFELSAGGANFTAGHGSTSSENRKGEARYFCRGETAVVLEGSAPEASFGKWRAELESALDSLSYDGQGTTIAIRPPTQPAPPTYFVHVVRSRGQTLGKIVEWYTGAYENWRNVARVNDNLPVPNAVLKVGREIKIPTDLLKRQDPLPEPKKRAARKPPAAKILRETPPQSPAEPEEEAPPLPPVIGPR